MDAEEQEIPLVVRDDGGGDTLLNRGWLALLWVEVLYSFFIHRNAFSARVLKADVMTNHDFIEELAILLATDTQDVHRFLNSFSGAMVAELLEHGKLSIKGLGRFAVMPLPPVKKITVAGTIYTPPGNRLIFERELFGNDNARLIAVARVGMAPGEAERFASSLAKVFGRAFKEKRELLLNGFGRFSLEKGVYGFVADSSLEALLNREYQDLDEVVVTQSDSVHASSHRNISPYAFLVTAVIAAGILLSVFYGRQIADVVLQAVAAEQLSPPVPSAAPVERSDVSSGAAPSFQGGTEDSVVLEKGEFTLIVATFRSESTARKESALLRSKGIATFIWPAFAGGVKYFRLMTGKFSEREQAAVYLKGMPKKMVVSAYIQHVIKRVVLHGKKEL
ncbi:MAG: hypothetical protein HGB23_02140 [Chlorobiaceae bacterium]|nr:hypothetical protein [Chlorobiaceae bacterium]